MNLSMYPIQPSFAAKPRTRGDEPIPEEMKRNLMSKTPHTRG